jgi:hypothetical protein
MREAVFHYLCIMARFWGSGWRICHVFLVIYDIVLAGLRRRIHDKRSGFQDEWMLLQD